jgi:hypothetical protein
MKSPDRLTVSKLDSLPNIGAKMASELQSIGISHPKQLIGQSAMGLYLKLCAEKGESVDYCVIDVFMSAVDFMEGAKAKPWWFYTAKRKEMMIPKS